MSFIDRAEAVRHFARSAKMGLKLVNKAAESKMRAERRLGQLLAEMDLRGGDHVSDIHHMRVTLKEFEISQNQSTRCQKEAEVPEEEFGKLVEAARKYEFEFTTATLLRLATKLRKKREVNATGQHRSPRRRSATSSPVEIIAELEDHCAVFDGILSIVYDAAGPVDLHFGQRKHLRRLIREFKSLLDDLKEHAVGQDSAGRG